MSKADLGRTRTEVTQAVIELFESRQMLTFTPIGNPIIAANNTVGAVDSLSVNEAGRYVVVGTRSQDVIISGNTVTQNNVYINSYNAGNNSVIPGGQAQAITTDNASFRADVANTGTGSFIVVWQSDATAANGSIINMERYSITGISQTQDVPVLVSSGVGDANDPHVAVAADQTFVVVWESNDAGSFRIYQQRYNADGTPNGGITMASDNNVATSPDVQMNQDGTYVVVWNSASATLAQRFSSTGAAVGGPITVANVSASQPVVGVATDGSFVVAWSASETSGSANRNIFARRYNASGAALGAEFVASSDTAGDQQFPQISVSGDGKFTIGWARASTTPTQYDSIGFATYVSGGQRLSDDTLIEDVAFTVLDNDTPRFGIGWPDGINLTVAYAGDSGFGTPAYQFDDAEIVKFEGQLTMDLDDNPHTIQLFGTPVNIQVINDGVTTNYSTDLFTSISITTGDSADYIRAKSVTKDMIVISNAGNDTVITSSGDDSVESGAGNDNVVTGDGDDYANGGDDQDSMYGGNGSDTLTGGSGKNVLYGEEGDDLLNGGSRTDTLYGGNGNDRIRGGAGGDALIGGNGDDDLRGGDGNDGFLGGNGDDYMLGGEGDDTLRGGDGNDSLLGEAANDYLYGDWGTDFLDGGSFGPPKHRDVQTDYGFTDGQDFLSNIEVQRTRNNVKSA